MPLSKSVSARTRTPTADPLLTPGPGTTVVGSSEYVLCARINLNKITRCGHPKETRQLSDTSFHVVVSDFPTVPVVLVE